MKVEMVLGEIREDRDVEVDRVCPMQLERMRGDFHRTSAVAAVEHLAKGAVKVDRLGRGPLHLALPASDDRRNRAEQPGLATSGLEQRPQQERGRGLAVGTCYAGDGQRRGRIAV